MHVDEEVGVEVAAAEDTHSTFQPIRCLYAVSTGSGERDDRTNVTSRRARWGTAPDSVVRDRLAGIAQARGTTMGALLETESRRLEIEQRWSEIEAAYERIQREDPDGWADYLGELAEVSAGEPDLAAEREWPEYSQ